jgi:hypothetical protein
MRKFSCPSCGAEITFQSSITVSCVCSYCRSLVVRHDVNVEAIGKMAELPDDISPFQLGTAGRFNRAGFSLIGRMKIGWNDGMWNEWFTFTDSGAKGWLAEAQGFLAISFEKQVDLVKFSTVPGGRDFSVDTPPILGSTLFIDGKKFGIEDVKEAECIGSEGELPFPAPRGRKTRTVDMLGDHGEFAGLEYAEGEDKPRLYVGQYVDFDDLQFSNLRDLAGWNIKRGAAAGFGKKKA